MWQRLSSMSATSGGLMRRLAHRLLFVAAAPQSAATQIAGTDDQFVITGLLIAGVRAILDAPEAFDPPVLIGSGVQVRVYDGDSTSDLAKRVNICFLVRRPPDVTRAACQDYWRHQHAHLALENMQYLRLTRYRQVHTMAVPLPGLDDTFDGVVYAEKRSFLQLFLDLLKPNTARFNSTVVVDECHFTDSTPVTLMRRLASW